MTTKTLQSKIDAISDLLRSITNEQYPEPLDRLQALRMIRETADSALADAVADARNHEWPWESIARALGTTRQSAWERYHA